MGAAKTGYIDFSGDVGGLSMDGTNNHVTGNFDFRFDVERDWSVDLGGTYHSFLASTDGDLALTWDYTNLLMRINFGAGVVEIAKTAWTDPGAVKRLQFRFERVGNDFTIYTRDPAVNDVDLNDDDNWTTIGTEADAGSISATHCGTFFVNSAAARDFDGKVYEMRYYSASHDVNWQAEIFDGDYMNPDSAYFFDNYSVVSSVGTYVPPTTQPAHAGAKIIIDASALDSDANSPNAYNGDENDRWEGSGTSTNRWFKVELAESSEIDTIEALTDDWPATISVEGSDNDSDWTTLSQSFAEDTDHAHVVITLDAAATYKYFRINGLTGAAWWKIRGIAAYLKPTAMQTGYYKGNNSQDDGAAVNFVKMRTFATSSILDADENFDYRLHVAHFDWGQDIEFVDSTGSKFQIMYVQGTSVLRIHVTTSGAAENHDFAWTPPAANVAVQLKFTFDGTNYAAFQQTSPTVLLADEASWSQVGSNSAAVAPHVALNSDNLWIMGGDAGEAGHWFEAYLSPETGEDLHFYGDIHTGGLYDVASGMFNAHSGQAMRWVAPTEGGGGGGGGDGDGGVLVHTHFARRRRGGRGS